MRNFILFALTIDFKQIFKLYILNRKTQGFFLKKIFD